MVAPEIEKFFVTFRREEGTVKERQKGKEGGRERRKKRGREREERREGK